jgi:hypothetical protein
MKKLTPAHDAELRHLRGQVDRLEGEAYRTSPVPDAQNDLWLARQELKNFVSGLRQNDYQI